MSANNFATFKDAFLGDLVVPEDPDYEKAIARWALGAVRRAKIVAFVRGTADVALAIDYAKTNKLPIAVRGGGHSPYGASSSEGGLVIDLSRYLDGVRIDPEQKLAYVGGGAIWETVDKGAIEHGLATVAGTVNHTGVGGLTLGGGFGWLSGSYGLVIDNLVQATVVTANGSVLTASDDENSDLFFGIRGGGVNFGVVTEFVLRLHPQRRKVYAGHLVFEPSVLERLISVTEKWFEADYEKAGLTVFLSDISNGQPVVMMLLFYNGSEAEGREIYKPFFELGPVSDDTKEILYEEMNALQNFAAKPGQGFYFKGLAQGPSDYKSICQAWDKIKEVATIPGFAVGSIILEYFSLGRVRSVPLEATAFRRASTVNVLVGFVWTDNKPENDAIAKRYAHDVAEILGRGQSALTTSESLGYSNYDPEAVVGNRDKAKLVFAENYPRLQRIKRKYDPEVIFNKWFPITPA